MAPETTMKAIVQDRYGDLDVLEFMDIDTPVVNADAVLVRVHAAAVGKGDWLTVRGLPYVARMRYGLPNQSTLFQASMWPDALRRPATT
jgi:NADPH:quinone reductase-like Zn-dependent oxidoreductase